MARQLAYEGVHRREEDGLRGSSSHRRIEHHVLDRLYAELDAANIRLDYRATEKNKPLQEFLTALVPGIDGSQAPVLEASEFSSRQPGLPHRVVIQK